MDIYTILSDKIQATLDSRVTTILLTLVTVLALGFLGWGSFQYYKVSTSNASQKVAQSSFMENNSIVRSLPHRTPFYSISYDRKGNEPVVISIFAKSPYYRYQALQYLLRKDQEVTIRHTINFVNYESPLEGEPKL